MAEQTKENPFSLACRRAVEALKAFENISNTDVQHLAASTSTKKPQEENPLRLELASRFPTYKSILARSNDSPRIMGKRSNPNLNAKGPSKRGRPSASSIVHKDLIIIPDPKMDQVPTHRKRIQLEEKGLVVHEFPFDRKWDAFELKLQIRKQFPKEDCLFEFLKACYGKLVHPKLAPGVEMSGEVLLKLSGQGGIYVRSLENLMTEYDDYDDHDDGLQDDDLDDSQERKDTYYSKERVKSKVHKPEIVDLMETEDDYDDPPQMIAYHKPSLNCTSTSTVQKGTEVTASTQGPVASNLSTSATPGPVDSNPSTSATQGPVASNPSTSATPGPVASNISTSATQGLVASNPLTSATQGPVASNPQAQQSTVSSGSSVSQDSLNDFEAISTMLHRLSSGSADLPLKNIEIHRAKLREELICIFKDQEVFQSMLIVRLIAYDGNYELGVGSGVLREVFTCFWQEFSYSLSLGSSEKVPTVRHDYGKREWEAIARILVYGYAAVGYFPIVISRAFICCVLFGEESISKESLMDSFKVYISGDDKELIDRALSQFDPNDEDLQDLLSNFKCYKLPQTSEELTDVLHEIAHQELIQKPRYIADSFSPTLNYLRVFELFQTTDGVQSLYSVKKPIAKNIVKLFSVTPSTPAESECFDHFKRFIRNLEKNNLLKLLQFMTGSDVIITDQITINFSTLSGSCRRPIARTCGPTLELPSTYQSYNELTEEFLALLSDKEAWSFNIS